MTAVVTIDVYGFSQAGFLTALDAAGVRLLLDVRQRRGVRGGEFAWANSARLVKKRSRAELAPTPWRATAR